MQIVGVSVPAKHQITRINELELTFNWKWNSKQRNHITGKSQRKINTTFQNFLYSHIDYHKDIFQMHGVLECHSSPWNFGSPQK